MLACEKALRAAAFSVPLAPSDCCNVDGVEGNTPKFVCSVAEGSLTLASLLDCDGCDGLWFEVCCCWLLELWCCC